MKQETKDKIITRAIHFIKTNTKDESYRIGSAIIEELKLVKKLTMIINNCATEGCNNIINSSNYCEQCNKLWES